MNNKNKEEKTFFEKYRTDKQYKAKVQLAGYLIFVFGIIVFLNVANMLSPSTGNITSPNNDIINQGKNNNVENKKSNLLKKMDDNYEFDIKVSITTKKEENEETKEVSYTGKRAETNTEIFKKASDITTNFYKIESRYYKKDSEQHQLAKEEEIYDIIEKEYIEWDDIKEYIEKASLDHVTDYSSGKKEYVYHLKVKDIIKSHQETDEVEIKIVEENETLKIDFDYTNLIKASSKDVKECKMTVNYTNIDKVEEFTAIEEIEVKHSGEQQ